MLKLKHPTNNLVQFLIFVNKLKTFIYTRILKRIKK